MEECAKQWNKHNLLHFCFGGKEVREKREEETSQLINCE